MFVGRDFKNTFKSAGALSGKDGAAKALVIIILFVALWGGGLLAVGLIHLRETHLAVIDRKQLLEEHGTETARQTKLLISSYIDGIIPAVYHSTGSVWRRFWNEISLHHRYFHLIVADTRRSDLYDRFYRTIKILTVQTLTIFLQAVLFDLQRPVDDGSCDSKLTQGSCLEEKTVLDHSLAYCEWDDGVCSYDETSFSEQALVYVIIICTAITALCKMPIDKLLTYWICPVANGDESIKVNRAVPANLHQVQQQVARSLDNQTDGHGAGKQSCPTRVCVCAP